MAINPPTSSVVHQPSLPLLFALLFLIGLSGCSSSRKALDGPGLPTLFPGHSAAQLEALLRTGTDSVQTIQADASISVRSPIQRGNFSATLTHRRGDSLYAVVSPGFGIEAVRALITTDSFFVHDRINKELMYGSLAHLSDLTSFPVTVDLLLPLLLGLYTPQVDAGMVLDADASYYYLKEATTGKTYTIDPRFWRVVRYEERRTSGTLVEERTFSEFEMVDGVYVPRRQTLRRPQDDVTATIFYRRLDLNTALPPFDWQVNGSPKRVLMDGQ
jgi:hypothetical protein